jgi:hypothetical protein
MGSQMIVEPASIHSRSPLRRLLRAAGFVAPIALFATIVTAGLLGPKPAQDARVDASASADAGVSPSAAPTASPVATTIGPLITPSAAGFPARYRTLAAVLPSAVVEVRASAGGPPAMVLVAGYLALAGQPSGCASPMITDGAWCDRFGTLFESTPAGGLGIGARPPHLHVTIPAGVVLPTSVTSPGAASVGFVPVELIGRFAVPGSCRADPQACDQGFVVERLLWAGGSEAALQPLLEPRQGAGLSLTPPVSSDANVVTLVAVLARPATVARLDAAAGAVAERLKSPTTLVWYLRDVILADDGALMPRWLLLDPNTGTLLATAPSDSPPVAVAAPRSTPQPSAAPQG